MAKRRSTELEWWQPESRPLPSKKQAGAGFSVACGSNENSVKLPAAPAYCLGAGATATSGLSSQEATLEVWLAVAAQVQDALAALPGWIQMTQNVQADQPEVLSSLSSASTPLAVQQHETNSSLPQHPQQHQLLSQQLQLFSHYPSSISHSTAFASATANLQPSSSSPAPTLGSLQSPAAPVAAAPSPTPAPAPQPDFPAHPAAGSFAPDSCTSDTDTTATACCGWFSKCRGCCQLTAGEVELQGEVVPLCRGCASSLHRRPPAERDAVVHRIMRAHATLCQREAAAAGASTGAAAAGACGARGSGPTSS